MLRRWIKYIAAVFALVAAFATATQVSAVGYWNLPGSVCQCSGYGYGAGYHAKFVLGPITPHDCFAHNEVRLPYAPQPPCAGCGYGGYGHCYGQPSVLAPSVMPTVAPSIAPESVSPMPVEPEPVLSAPLEPAPVELAPESSLPAVAPSTLPPPPAASAPKRALFDPPVEP